MAPIASILMDQRFVFAMTWGLGGSLRSQYHGEFNKQLRELLNTDRKELSAEQQSSLISLINNLPPLDEQTTVFDFRLDNSTRYFS